MLEIRDLSVFYGDAQALDGVNLSVGDGQVVALLGANGAGKTSLIRTVAGILKPRAGSIRFDGREIGGLDSHHVCNLGVGQVAEGRQVFPSLSVLENLQVGAMLPRARAHAAAALDRVFAMFPRLKERAAQAAGTLSGGEQQMVAMARALMGRPRVLCMDEPTMGLSPLFVDRVLEQIRAVNKQGVTVFMIEQNAHLALQIADFGYVLQSGRIALSGTAKELLGDPRIRDAYLGGGTDVVSGGRR